MSGAIGWIRLGTVAVCAACAPLLALAGSAHAASDVTVSSNPSTPGGWDDTNPFLSVFTPPSDDANVNVGEITTRLNAGKDVSINTNGPPGPVGTITVADAVSWDTVNTFALSANGGLAFNAAVASTSGKILATTSFGAITQTDSAPLTLPGGATVGSGSGTATLTNAANDFGGTVQLGGASMSIRDSSGLLTLGGNFNITGAFSATADGTGIAQASALTIGGAATFNAPGGSVNLPVTANDIGGMISMNALTDATVAANDSISLGASTVGGNLSVTAGSAAGLEISQPESATLDVGGDTTLQVQGNPGSIDLRNSANMLDGAINLQGDHLGDVTIASGSTGADIGTVPAAPIGNIDLGLPNAAVSVPALTVEGAFTLDAAQLTQSGPIHTGFLDAATSGDMTLTDVTSDGLLQLEAGDDLILPAGAQLHADNGGVLGTDLATPGIGPGGFTMGAGSTLASADGAFAIYTARRSQNEIAPDATINGANFSPGTEFVDTAREVWGTAYDEGTALAPFTIFYEEDGEPPAPPVSGPPETTITKKPRNKLKTRAGARRKRVTYEFIASVAGASFTCTLDRKSVPCASPFKKRVKKGRHTFSVAASVPAGADPTPATDTFRVKRRR
ncbi:MAG TPA: hypothetical protein VHF58_11485 [Solirubrobacterales bacterium]|nr:hypothetical protein [Solirubrobacterales bacterium]